VAVAVAQAVLSLWRLGTASWHIDELVYVRASREGLDTELTHPPLGKLLMAVPQWVFGESLTSARVAPVLAGALVGVCLFLLVRRTVGFWAGIAVWAAWVLLPRSVGLMAAGTHLDVARLERFALLDAFAAAGMAATLLLGWRWAQRGGWGPAVATAVAGGLATASKASGATALLVAGGAVLITRPGRRAVAEVALAAAVSVATFALTYLPFGTTAWSAFREMLDFQLGHADTGHAVFVAGQTYDKPPWWVFGAYQVEADGWLLTFAVVAAVIAALVLVRHPVRWYLLAAVVVPLVLLTLSPVVIRHYRFIALPGQVALVALGVRALLAGVVWQRVLGVVVAVPLLLAAAGEVHRVLTLQPRDYAQLAQTLEQAEAAGRFDPDEQVVVLRGVRTVADAHAPDVRFLADLPTDGDAAEIAAIVLDPTSTLRFPAPELERAAMRLGLVSVQMGRLEAFVAPELQVRFGAPVHGQRAPTSPTSG
jgi:4-amino-4-deoxy-L-arabinose transferase-like glycosyltransferase